MPTELHPTLRHLPPDMVRSVQAYALDDADLVGTFLRDVCGLPATPDHPVRLPADFLTELAAALRLFTWESAGFDLGQVAAVPEPRTALLDLFRRAMATDDGSPANWSRDELSARVIAAYAERFAWPARSELGAEVVLGPADQENVLEAVADFLWQIRPR
jgi:hypothetical protein